MHRLSWLLFLLATVLTTTGPAHACMYQAQPVHIFWKAPPEVLEPDEVVLEVRLLTEVSQAFVFSDDEGEEYVTWTNCYGANYLFEVVGVVRGKFSGDRVVLASGDIVRDMPLSPFATRLIVGTINTDREFAPYPPFFQRPVFEDFVPLSEIDWRMPPGQPRRYSLEGDHVQMAWHALSRLPKALELGLLGSGPLEDQRKPTTGGGKLALSVAVLGLALTILAFLRRRTR